VPEEKTLNISLFSPIKSKQN